MCFENLYTTHSCHRWHDFFPKEQHYVNYQPHIIYAMNKVDDVYYAFSNARYNGYMTENENYGDLIAQHDSLHLNMVRSNFLMNALNFYFFAIDLSWQVLYFYAADSSYYFLCDHNEYDKFSNTCNNDNVVRLLRYRQEHALLEIHKTFSTNELVLALRELYNYMKHRGTMHFEGLGEQYQEPLVGFRIGEEDITFRFLNKRVQNIDEFKEKLIDLDRLFHCYFENILRIIVPNGYVHSQANVLDYANVTIGIYNFKVNEFNRYKRKFDAFYYAD